MGWGSRTSPSSYVFNHIGNFAAAGEAICRSLFLDGVPHRFPDLRFAFLEGGVAWAANLYSDIIGHYEKRNREAVTKYNPEKLDRALMTSLIEEYGDERARKKTGDLEEAIWAFNDPGNSANSLDEFEWSGVSGVADIQRLFAENFYFGCEADDPANATAFDTRRNPGGLRLNAVFSSDIGHWDVPDNREVLSEAYELVEKDLLGLEDFRAFTYTNAVNLYTGTNPNFFSGTVLEDEVSQYLAAQS